MVGSVWKDKISFRHFSGSEYVIRVGMLTLSFSMMLVTPWTAALSKVSIDSPRCIVPDQLKPSLVLGKIAHVKGAETGPVRVECFVVEIHKLLCEASDMIISKLEFLAILAISLKSTAAIC